MIDYRDLALKALVPGCQYASQNNEIFWDVEENNGVVCPSQEQIQAKIIELQTEYEANEYQRKRAVEYPSWQDQLDKIYHEGLDAWKSEIKAIKEKYPKS